MSFNRNMAIWIKGREYDSETNIDGEIVVIPKGNKNLFATIDPEKQEAHYWQDYPEPVVVGLIPIDELRDLEYFVNLLIGKED